METTDEEQPVWTQMSNNRQQIVSAMGFVPSPTKL
jgi:hypothetical protein